MAYTIRMILRDNTVGIGDATGTASGIKVYPNPSNGSFLVDLSGMEGTAQMTITDVAGRTVYTETVVATGNLQHALDLDLKAGAYLLNVMSSGQTRIARIVVN